MQEGTLHAFQKVVGAHESSRQAEVVAAVQRKESFELALGQFQESQLFQDAKAFLALSHGEIVFSHRAEGNGTSSQYILNKDGFRYSPSPGLMATEQAVTAAEIATQLLGEDAVVRFKGITSGEEVVNRILTVLNERAGK